LKISEQIIETVAQMKATNVFPKEIRMMHSVYKELIKEVESLGSLVLSDSTEVPPEFNGLPITIFEDEHNPYLEFVVTP